MAELGFEPVCDPAVPSITIRTLAVCVWAAENGRPAPLPCTWLIPMAPALNTCSPGTEKGKGSRVFGQHGVLAQEDRPGRGAWWRVQGPEVSSAASLSARGAPLEAEQSRLD